MVLPPDILRFRRLFGACLDGSAKRADRVAKLSDAARSSGDFICVRASERASERAPWCVCVRAPTWRRHHPLPFLEEAGLEAVSGAEAVGLVSGHQLLHGLQNHTQLVDRAERRRVRSNKTERALTGHRFAIYD